PAEAAAIAGAPGPKNATATAVDISSERTTFSPVGLCPCRLSGLILRKRSALLIQITVTVSAIRGQQSRDIVSNARQAPSRRHPRCSNGLMNRRSSRWLKELLIMERARIPGTSLDISRVALGTWAIGGWMWGGTDEAQSIATLRAAVEHGVDLIDTAPAYGFGHSAAIVGKGHAGG